MFSGGMRVLDGTGLPDADDAPVRGAQVATREELAACKRLGLGSRFLGNRAIREEEVDTR